MAETLQRVGLTTYHGLHLSFDEMAYWNLDRDNAASDNAASQYRTILPLLHRLLYKQLKTNVNTDFNIASPSRLLHEILVQTRCEPPAARNFSYCPALVPRYQMTRFVISSIDVDAYSRRLLNYSWSTDVTISSFSINVLVVTFNISRSCPYFQWINVFTF